MFFTWIESKEEEKVSILLIICMCSFLKEEEEGMGLERND